MSGANIQKEASGATGAISKSLKELHSNVAKLKPVQNASEIAANHLKSDFGFTGFLGGAAKKGIKGAGKTVLKQLSPDTQKTVRDAYNKTVKPVTNSIKKARNKMDTTLANADMAVGKKLSDYTGKENSPFIHKTQVEVQPVKGDTSGNKTFKEVRSYSATQPIRHVRDAALPILGSMYVSEKVNKSGIKYDPVREGGYDPDDYNDKEASEKDALIDKIASLVENDNIVIVEKSSYTTKEKQFNDIVKLAGQANSLLKEASNDKTMLLSKIASLESQYNDLRSSIEIKEKLAKSTKLADEMLEKGMIKKADYDAKVNELIGLEKNAYTLVEDLVNKSVANDDFSEEFGVSSMFYLQGDNETPSKKQFVDCFK